MLRLSLSVWTSVYSRAWVWAKDGNLWSSESRQLVITQQWTHHHSRYNMLLLGKLTWHKQNTSRPSQLSVYMVIWSIQLWNDSILVYFINFTSTSIKTTISWRPTFDYKHNFSCFRLFSRLLCYNYIHRVGWGTNI